MCERIRIEIVLWSHGLFSLSGLKYTITNNIVHFITIFYYMFVYSDIVICTSVHAKIYSFLEAYI